MKHIHKHKAKFKLTKEAEERIKRVKLFNDLQKKKTKHERKKKKQDAWNKMMLDALKK